MSDLYRLKRLRNSETWHLSKECADWPEDPEISQFQWAENLDSIAVCDYCRSAAVTDAEILHD